MYVQKPCIIGECKEERTPLVRQLIPEFPGFYCVLKQGKIKNENLDFLFERCIDENGYIVSRKLLEECERKQYFERDTTKIAMAVAPSIHTGDSATKELRVDGESYLNLVEKDRGKSLMTFPPNNDDIAAHEIDQMSMEDPEAASPRVATGSFNQSEEESYITGPSICMELKKGFEFIDAEKNSTSCVSRILTSLNAIKEAKSKEHPGDETYTARYRSFDMVISFPLSSWPSEALAFFTRERKSGWPDTLLLKEIEKTNCYLVCKGIPLSKDFDRMFRLSFSEAELLISKNVPEKLRDCYRWTKLLLKIHLSSPKILASYHVKTMFFWYLENDCSTDNVAKVLLDFLDFIFENCRKHNIPNYFYPEINMVNHIKGKEMEIFTSKLRDLRVNLPYYLNTIILSDKMKPCGNKEAVEHVSQLLASSNRRIRFPTEYQFWSYVFLILYDHKFSDAEIDQLISVFSGFVDNKMHPHRKHYVEIMKKLTCGDLQNEEEYLNSILSRKVNFSDQVLEALVTFLQDYAKLNPEILGGNPES